MGIFCLLAQGVAAQQQTVHLNGSADSSIVIQYKSEGIDEHWTDLKMSEAVNTATLNNATYTFRIKPVNRVNSIVTNAGSITISQERWWQTDWSIISIIGIICCGVIGFYYYRLSQINVQTQLRNSIAHDLHDEVGSTLSSIHIASRLIQNEPVLNELKIRGLIDQIVRNSEKSLDSMNDIVWSLKTQPDQFSDLVNRMRIYGVEILEPLQCDLTFTVSPEASKIKLNIEQRKDLYLIFKEAINNLAKYSGARNCTVIIDYMSDKNIVMSIKDDGTGFDQHIENEKINPEKRGGNGLKSMNYRAGQLKGKIKITTSPGTGTNLILQFKSK
jgi:signal transduction histidine kinase